MAGTIELITPIHNPNQIKVVTMEEILPYSFGKGDLGEK